MELQQALSYIKRAESEFFKWRNRVIEGDRYYDNDADINRTGAAAIDEVNSYLKKIGSNPLRSADNRVSTNWHEILVVQKVAYMFTYPPTFDVGGNKTLSKQISDMLGDDYAQIISDLGTYASNAGDAWLQYWIDPVSGKFKYAAMKADQCVGFTDPRDISKKVIAVVRAYFLKDKDDKEKLHYEVWDDKEALFINGETLKPEKLIVGGKETDRITHDFGEPPFIEFANNPQKSSDLKKYKALVDCYNKIVSGFANDLDDIQEILLIIRDFNGETETEIQVPERGPDGQPLLDEDGDPICKTVTKPINLMQQLKAQKYATTSETGGIDKLSIDVPYEAREVALDLLQKKIYISGMGVDPNPEHTGQATGAYVDHLYYLLELKSGLMESRFKPALAKLVRAMLRHIGRGEDLKIEQTWTRNKPKIDNEIVDRLNATPSTVMSDYTKRRKHPDIDDPEKEDKLVEDEQNQARKNLMDSFEIPQDGGVNE